VTKKQEQLPIDQFFDWRDRFITISSDVGNLLLGRYLFRETQTVIAHNRTLEGLFTRWIRINYANSTILGIRRAVDTDKRALSLANFLRDLIADPNVVTRQLVLNQPVIEARRRGKRHRRHGIRNDEVLQMELRLLDQFYKTLATESRPDRLDLKLIGQDLTLIQRKAKKVERFATKRLAHFDERGAARIKYTEIDDALDAFDLVIAKYSTLFRRRWERGTTFEKLSPDWKEVFEVEWKRSGSL
jgi:hypothetical protein